jgi:ribosomal protein L21E
MNAANRRTQFCSARSPGKRSGTLQSTSAGADLVSTFKVGDKVTTAATVKPARFAGRTGRVVEVNTSADEVAVKFGAVSRHSEPTTWFRPSELEAGYSLHAHACAPIASGTGFPAAKAS